MTAKPKIQAIIDIFSSKFDRNGNREWAFRYTDTVTGKSAWGTISGGESNCRAVALGLGLSYGDFTYTTQELPIRQFNSMTKKWKYAGCTQEQLAEFVRSFQE